MRKIDIGILRAGSIRFELIGDFLLNGEKVPSKNDVFADDVMLCFNGGRYETLCFEPRTDDCCFVLHDVVIGVGFHWQRKESQMFKGELRFIVEDGEVRAINRLFIEDYLVSVISSEMSATSSLEFLKAHTVISRSWLYAQLDRSERVGNAVLGYENNDETIRWYAREDHTLFDFCADDHCQRYQGITRAINPNVARAVEATRGIVLKYDGKVCDARFSKCCGGVTERFSTCWEDVDYGYLKAFRDCDGDSRLPQLTSEEGVRAWIESVPPSYCSTDDKVVLSQILNGYDRETNDFYRWKVVYSQSELSSLIAERSGVDFGLIENLLPVERGESGRIVKLKIVGSKATRIVGKELEIRRWLSKSHLYSSAFIVDKEYASSGETLFVLKGAGWGHGVGLCQIGAAMMGERGCPYEKILSFYYPGSVLEKAY
ncbi:MAG: SpoIID/LytB domain-containing protein [Bacteroidaceae bacterium]|nr:SpoIID/LytB domain-containing protein [Bacteroidaceae bacterium]